jgi:hypothetical protein
MVPARETYDKAPGGARWPEGDAASRDAAEHGGATIVIHDPGSGPRGSCRHMLRLERSIALPACERRCMPGLIQQDLADPVGMTGRQAQRHENGITRIAAGRVVAEVMNIEVGRLFASPPGRPPAEQPEPQRPPAGFAQHERMLATALLGESASPEALPARPDMGVAAPIPAAAPKGRRPRRHAARHRRRAKRGRVRQG